MSGSPPPQLSRTPLYDEHVRAGARMVPFAGWEMPLSYEGQLAEHMAVRNAAGIFDVSHMGQVRFRGPRAVEFLQRLVPGDIAALAPGKERYTQLCNERGGVIDDLIISRLAEDEFFAVVNASRRDADMDWMRTQAHAMPFDDVVILDESDDWAMLAVQGPEALAVCNDVLGWRDWTTTSAFTIHPMEMHGHRLMVSRTGYTGEVGVEVLCHAGQAAQLWRAFLDAGAKPCGLAARDSLRLEAGYCLYGNDLDEQISPVEAGLGWSVGWKKEERFIAQDVLDKQRLDGAPRRLVGLQTDSRRPLRHGDPVLLAGQKVGSVTSGGFSPVLNVGIALALVSKLAAGNATLEVQSRSQLQQARVVRPPFVQTSLSAKPPDSKP